MFYDISAFVVHFNICCVISRNHLLKKVMNYQPFFPFFTAFYFSSSWVSFHCLTFFRCHCSVTILLLLTLLFLLTILRSKLLSNYFCRETTDVLRRSGERDKGRQEVEQNLSFQIALVNQPPTRFASQ